MTAGPAAAAAGPARAATPDLVSTIIPVYNRPHLVREAVQSVLAQTYRPIEIVLVDDGSTDETAAVCDALAAAYPGVVRVVHRVNGESAAACNTGLGLITGEFVQFLDSDDLLAPEKFARQVAGLRAHLECGISYGRAREYEFGRPWSGRPARGTGHAYPTLFPWVLHGRLWPAPSPLYRRSVVDETGPFLEILAHADWEFECRVGRRSVRLHYCDEYVADVRGVHALEGRKKNDMSGARLPDLAVVFERVLDHACAAGVGAEDLRKFSLRVFAAAERCGTAGFDIEARRLLRLSGRHATPARQTVLAVFALAIAVAGGPRAVRWRRQVDRSRMWAACRAAFAVPSAWFHRWRHRAREAAVIVAGESPLRWPSLLWHRWVHRRSAQRSRA